MVIQQTDQEYIYHAAAAVHLALAPSILKDPDNGVFQQNCGFIRR
jgi:hypothetical protein